MKTNNNRRLQKVKNIIEETAQIYLNCRPPNRPLGNTTAFARSHNYQSQQYPNKKNTNQVTNLEQLSKDDRISQNLKRLTNLKKKDRYLQVNKKERQLLNLSPYLDNIIEGNINDKLKGDTQKFRTRSMRKDNSPKFYARQPHTSLSTHNNPGKQIQKRKISLIVDDKLHLIDEARELFKNKYYSKSIELLKRYLVLCTNSAQGHYLLGMSYINTSEHLQGVDELLYCLEIDPSYKKSLYVVISLIYKKMARYQEALSILDQGLQLYPEYYDCLIYKGKIYLKIHDYQNALKWFSQAIVVNKSKGFAYVGKGICQKQLGNNEQAIKTWGLGIKSDMGHVCAEKRGLLLFELQKYDEALKSLQFCTHIKGYYSSIANYHKGILYYADNKNIEALLSFEEALKCDNHYEYVTTSAEMMMQIKIEEKDFYEAFHIINRTQEIDLNKSVINEWKLFIEATLFLMKKKYKQGIATYKSLLQLSTFKLNYALIENKRSKERYTFLKPLIYLYKAFGELADNKPLEALEHYEAYDQICAEVGVSNNNISKIYNSLLINIFFNFPHKSKRYVQEALKVFKNKPQPYLYLCFQLIFNNLKKTSDQQVRMNIVKQALKSMCEGITHLPQLSNNHISSFFYYRSILYLYLDDYNNAITDVDKAIEKSEDNISKYFYLRGLISSIFGNFSQAVQDHSVAINLDSEFAKAYLERAKCLQIEGNANEAFSDLQKFITLCPEDQYIHKYAGYLLFQNCAYEDCLTALKHGEKLANDSDLTLTKAKCHFLLGQFEAAVINFTRYDVQTGSKKYQHDIIVMQICANIKETSTEADFEKYLIQLNAILDDHKQQQLRLFKFYDLYQIQACIFMMLGKYQIAINKFIRSLELLHAAKKAQMKLNIQESQDNFDDQWSEIEMIYNLSLCHACNKDFQKAKSLLIKFSESNEKGRNWNSYIELLDDLIEDSTRPTATKVEFDVFEQHHRVTKKWPKIPIPNLNIYLSLAYSYPFVEPPELLPQFDQSLFEQFHVSHTERKPQAPWINRLQGGLTFTPNVQAYDNLELSETSKQNDEDENEKANSDFQQPQQDNDIDVRIGVEDLKKKLRLNSKIQMKLNKFLKNDR